jgi:hypothetical protein
MSTGCMAKAAKRAQVDDIAALTRELHATAARARAAGRFSDREVRDLRLLLKLGGRGRRRCVGMNVSEMYRDRIAELQARCPEPVVVQLPLATAGASASPSAAGAPAKSEEQRRTGRNAPRSASCQRRSGTSPAARGLDGLSEAQIEDLAVKRRVARRINAEGMSASEALKAEQVTNRSTRWAQKVAKRAKAGEALRDGRAGAVHPKTVMTPEVEALVMKWWYGRPAAGPKLVHGKVTKEIRQRRAAAGARGIICSLQEPSYQTVWHFLDSLPEAVKETRTRRGLQKWDKNARSRVEYNPTTYGNELWEMDNQQVKVWTRVKRGGEWVPVRAWLSSTIDVFSSASPGRLLSARRPDAWSTALCMRKSILPDEDPEQSVHGRPVAAAPDLGREFTGHDVAITMRGLGVRLEFCAPHDPDGKPHVERYHRALNEGLYKGLPGHIDAIGHSEAAAGKHVHKLLTIPQLRQEIDRWVRDVYHQTENSEFGETPLARWKRTAHIEVGDRNEIDRLLLQSNKIRTITKNGIRFMRRKGRGVRRGGHYWCPQIEMWWHAKVRLHYNPEDLRSVLVFDADSGLYIGEAWRMGGPGARYTAEDVITARRRTRKGLVERMKSYAAEVEREDRAAAEAWDQAHAMKQELDEASAEARAKTARQQAAHEAELQAMKRQRRQPPEANQPSAAPSEAPPAPPARTVAETLAAMKRAKRSA